MALLFVFVKRYELFTFLVLIENILEKLNLLENDNVFDTVAKLLY